MLKPTISNHVCIPAFFVLAALQVGCASFYSARSVQDQLNKSTAQLNSGHQSVRQAVETRLQIMKMLIATGADRTKPPYRELMQQSLELNKSYKALDGKRKRFDALVAPLQAELQGKDKIHKDNKALKDFLEQGKDLSKEYSEAGEELQERAKDFDETCKREKIYKVETASLKAQVAQGAAQAEANFIKVRQNIEETRRQNATLPDSRRKANEEILNSLSDDVSALEKHTQAIRALETKVRAELGEQVTAYVGPHMVTHTVVAQMEGIASEMRKVAEHYESTVKKGLR